jgi:hypothetical protein
MVLMIPAGSTLGVPGAEQPTVATNGNTEDLDRRHPERAITLGSARIAA